MFYIDEYNSSAIINQLPFVKKVVANKESELDSINPGVDENTFKYFWFLIGTTVGEHNESIQKLLKEKYGITTTDPADTVNAITDISETEKWIPFMKDIYPLIEDSVNGKYPDIDTQRLSSLNQPLPQALEPQEEGRSNEESGIVPLVAAAIIGAIGTLGGAGLGLASSKKNKQASKDVARSNALVGLSNVIAEKEKQKAIALEQQAKEKRMLLISIVILIVVSMIIAGIIIYNRTKNKG